ncbi:MAG: biosynthetic-type acetolactate synthase large subunit [Gammaproteobacteria bacterium]|nr:biosynthetic-type acetolactate synthase large subunit [Gammaproteobacteria bacterium]
MTSVTQAVAATPHPLAGKRMTGAEMLVQVLADEGVDLIFGYSGGAILPTYDAVFRFNDEQVGDEGEAPMRLVVPANEQGAGFMAAGYARATGKVGVAMVTSGPGATNTVTPVRDCMADSIPIVVICGQVPTHVIGTDAFQEAPVSAIMGSVAKHVFLVTSPAKLEETVRTAFEIARSGRPGPVVIDVPKDVQNWIGEFRGTGLLPIKSYRQRIEAVQENALSASEARAFFKLLGDARKPLLYVGGGAIHGEASAALSRFARRFQIPVTTTLMGIGAFDTTDSLALKMLGMHGMAYANYAVEDCDLLIAVGARFDDRVATDPDTFAPNARRVAHLDVDASEVGKVRTADWYHVGVLERDLDALTSWGERHKFDADFSAWLAELEEMRRVYALNYDRDSKLIQPNYVIEELNKHAKGEAIISTGVGQHQMWAAQYMDFKHPRLWLTSGSMGTMGFGLPAAVGAQFAYPERLVIDIDGDGSMRMNIGELETVTTYGLPVKVLVLNNFGDGMVRQWQKLFYKGRMSGTDKSLHRKDFIKAAQADGFEFAVRLDRKADVPRVVKEFVEFDGPAFLEVIIDPDAGVYPMVGPGLSYSQMITGDHIPDRGERDPDATPGGSSMF